MISEQLPNKSMSLVYIILLNWNGWRDTVECLESLLSLDYPEHRIVVCDNGSGDESLEKIKYWADGQALHYVEYKRSEAEVGGAPGDTPYLTLIRNDANLGFAGGNNVAMRYALARGDAGYCWLLNNDTTVEPDALTHLVRRLRLQPDTGICGSTIRLYHDRSCIQALGGGYYCRWIGLPWHYGRFTGRGKKINERRAEAWMNYVEGASMLVSRKFLDEVGLLCEDYFLYFEEADWALRAKGRFTPGYAAGSIVYHKIGGSIGTSSNPAKISYTGDYFNIRNRLLFTRRFYPASLPTVRIVIAGSFLLRLCLGKWDRAAMILRLLFNCNPAGASMPLKKLDSFAGRVVASVLPSPSRRELPSPVASVLLIRPGGIGDAVLLAPAIKSLKNIYPRLVITVLAEKRNAAVFSFVPGVDKVLCYDIPNGFFQAIRSHYDVVIDSEQWHRLSAVVARLVRAPVKIGFDTNERRRMFTNCVPYDQSACETDNFLALLKPLGVISRNDFDTNYLSLPQQSLSKALSLLQPLCSDRFIVIFPGASIPEKRWGADRFRRVAEALSACGTKVVVVGGKEDRQQGEVIAGGGAGLNLAGLTSLAETAAVMQRSALLLSGDSGVLHIAGGIGVPTVSLFGPGRAGKWAPRGDRHVVINKKLPCSPCTVFGNTPPCPYNIRCMSNITVNEVVDAVTMHLNRVGIKSSR